MLSIDGALKLMKLLPALDCASLEVAAVSRDPVGVWNLDFAKLLEDVALIILTGW